MSMAVLRKSSDFVFVCRADHYSDSRNTLTGAGGVFDGAQDAVAVARQLQFKPKEITSPTVG